VVLQALAHGARGHTAAALAPLERAPCYAVRTYAAEINTHAGIRTEAAGRA